MNGIEGRQIMARIVTILSQEKINYIYIFFKKGEYKKRIQTRFFRHTTSAQNLKSNKQGQCADNFHPKNRTNTVQHYATFFTARRLLLLASARARLNSKFLSLLFSHLRNQASD